MSSKGHLSSRLEGVNDNPCWLLFFLFGEACSGGPLVYSVSGSDPVN